ncbi:sensor histidine kinase [Sulfuricurvum sp.]|uniref:sensor histidine kinase n=1 Tax=Sulfuricurvum sp. TaxID=2025608 RepID=UPI00260C6B97|nr:HAMP domain-containing sensor histidine kinase [Sulfuricurvum sp.]MDD2266067.1 HAMP domain-containing sensor histidine kinase [Sulfuricurvum sp.]MDD2784361.1 HAMP domain-containing sensor histidine kinase [Sulfuricurvum sp.]HZF71426.1 HAMP domain-containing sensor histidine kinase [Sulfuricurvum sp.]
MFRSFTIALASLYVTTTAILITGIYYVHQILGVQHWGIIVFVSLIITLVAGGVLAKIAITPLREHFEHLERFSKETLHELNLPINTITANVQMLRKTHDDEKSLKRLERIETAAEMLKERYNELDYLIKKQTEREQIESFELRDVIEERLGFLRALYPAVEWEVVLESCDVSLDRIGFGKVIDNLVENGVKYSPHNPHITITLYNCVLSICDQGIGMDEITLMRIYDRYFQNDTTIPGYGIGLSLVKRYCDRHHINLHVSSKVGEGTCVKLEFKKKEKNGKQ